LQASWMDYASSMSSRVMNDEQRFKGIALTLEHALQRRTYLVGHALSMADLALFAVLGWPCALAEKTDVVAKLLLNYPSAARWVTMLASHPALQKATQLALGDAEEAIFADENVLEPLVPGMNALEGATPGNVVTRFPPEPSGYLHVRTSSFFVVWVPVLLPTNQCVSTREQSFVCLGMETVLLLLLLWWWLLRAFANLYRHDNQIPTYP
jgi:Glutathione S-transferase, C-terminal domain